MNEQQQVTTNDEDGHNDDDCISGDGGGSARRRKRLEADANLEELRSTIKTSNVSSLDINDTVSLVEGVAENGDDQQHGQQQQLFTNENDDCYNDNNDTSNCDDDDDNDTNSFLSKHSGPASQEKQRQRRQQYNSSTKKQRLQPEQEKGSPREQQQQQQDNNNNIEKSVSLTDWITSSAINVSIEALKLAGSATIQAGSAIVASPPTVHILLPTILSAIRDYYCAIVPHRIQDWLFVLSSSIYHICNTVSNTNAGNLFLHRLLIVGIDLIEIISSVTFRQYCIDCMSFIVKVIELLSTSEFTVVVQQLSVVVCRFFDIIHLSKIFFLDLSTALLSSVNMLSHPDTINAIAEVTANLCYTLEMQQYDIKNERRRRRQKQSSSGSRRSRIRHRRRSSKQQQQRRMERNMYQQQIYTDTLNLLNDPTTTVEDAILNSLGQRPPKQRQAKQPGSSGGMENVASRQEEELHNDDDAGGSRTGSIPSRIIVNNNTTDTKNTASSSTKNKYRPFQHQLDDITSLGRSDDDEIHSVTKKATSIKKVGSEKKKNDLSVNQKQQNINNWSKSVRDNVNVDYLSVYINQRNIDSGHYDNDDARIERQEQQHMDHPQEQSSTPSHVPMEQRNGTNTKNGKKDRSGTGDLEDLVNSNGRVIVRDVHYESNNEDEKLNNQQRRRAVIAMKDDKKAAKKSKSKLSVSSPYTSDDGSSYDDDHRVDEMVENETDYNDSEEIEWEDFVDSSLPVVAQQQEMISGNIRRFHSNLDKVLSRKRTEAVQKALDSDTLFDPTNKVHYGVIQRNKATKGTKAASAAAKGSGKEKVLDEAQPQLDGGKTLQDRLDAIRAELRASLQQKGQGKEEKSTFNAFLAGNTVSNCNNKIEKVKRWKRIAFIVILVLFVLSTITIWIGFGLYGMYIVFYGTQQQRNGNGNNIVIRVVKEVVHMNENGTPITPDTGIIHSNNQKQQQQQHHGNILQDSMDFDCHSTTSYAEVAECLSKKV